jgi:hypothetical protein
MSLRTLRYAGALYVAGALSVSPSVASPADAPLVTVIARDHAFEAPDTIRAGVTRFRLKDLGPTKHQLVIYRLADSVSLNEFYVAMKGGRSSPAGIRSLGGAQETEDIALVLVPGRYVFACMHGFDDGATHLSRGMFRAFTVVKAVPGKATALAPNTDATLTMSDYTYKLTGKLTPGRRVLRIVNNGPQEHHVMIQRLVPGRTIVDVEKWFAGGRRTERPVMPIFWGTTRQSPGETLYATIDVTAGGYILLCRVPDSGDARPHVDHGMRSEIRVSE